MEIHNNHRKAEVRIIFSEFEFPPMQDALLVGKSSPIGPEAARRMVDILSPDQYEIIRVDHEIIEAVVIRRSLTRMVPKDKLVNLLLEEGGKLAEKDSVVKAQIKTFVEISRLIQL